MGIISTIDYDKFPKQGSFKGRRCRVCFRYQDRTIGGVIVRDDREEPFRTIIQLDDGRFLLATECMYSPFPEKSECGKTNDPSHAKSPDNQSDEGSTDATKIPNEDS